jgi:sarcosine oxidase subunit alpha
MAPLQVQAAGHTAALEIASVDGDGWRAASTEPCDLVAVSGGWSPVVNLLSHRGVKPAWDSAQACFLAVECAEPVSVAGSAAGVWNSDDCVASGQAAAGDAIQVLRGQMDKIIRPPVGGWQQPIQALYEVKVPGRKLKSFVDPQHDVTTEDVRLAHREGFVSVEHLKRYTTLGMATDQGKMGNIIGLALMAEALGKEIPEVGTTTFRPPYTPVSIGALRGRSVGRHFRPLRRTPLHEWNLDHAGTMTEAGLWQRPWYFAREGEALADAYVREAETTRRTVGLCDVTSLGKIAVQGPDATVFLNRVYSNAFAKLPIGKARYGIMLRDDGLVMDDGTTWRLSETEYFMTTTTAHAAPVMAWLEELLQTRWSDLKVHVTSVSEQWAGIAVAGPCSRTVLEACVEDPARVSNDNFPFMGVIETVLKDKIPCRIARISFSGELAYEVYTPSDYGPAAMDLLWGVSEPMEGCLYGLEALGAMRIEKGHVTGAELDGRVTIEDAGLGRMASSKKSYIGSALRKRPELIREDRPRLVGIFPRDRHETFNAGAILCDADAVQGFGDGWISGVTHSPELGHWIGLGFIAGGREAWRGKSVVAADPVRKNNVAVEIVSPHMVDPDGERLYG